MLVGIRWAESSTWGTSWSGEPSDEDIGEVVRRPRGPSVRLQHNLDAAFNFMITYFFFFLNIVVWKSFIPSLLQYE